MTLALIQLLSCSLPLATDADRLVYHFCWAVLASCGADFDEGAIAPAKE
ncbi:MAG: hypothetical protein ACFB8W_11445 [Elainellaceae cyanobacterium]